MKRFQDIEQASRCRTNRNYTQSNLSGVSIYRVGQPFRHGYDNWPIGAQFTYSPGGLELTMFHRDIRDNVVTDILRGQAEFALIVDLPVIVLTYRFGESISWSDLPYSWHLQPISWRVVPSIDHSPEARVLLWISLVDADDGIIHAQRGVTAIPGLHPRIAPVNPPSSNDEL